MIVKQITLTDLRRMNGKEGLILQGCGGETQEWVDGINEMLTDKGILLNDTKFENVSVFQNDGVTCILYPFEDVHLDIGKLAMWRLQSYTAFAGMWLSDYVGNRLGGFEPEQMLKLILNSVNRTDRNIRHLFSRQVPVQTKSLL